MDSASHSPSALPFDALAITTRVLADIELGLDTTMVGDPSEGCALLDAIAARLLARNTRVVRVASPPEGMTLGGMLIQLRLVISGLGQAPEQAIEALTRLDPSCNRIVLLVSNAETLERSALRAIQFAAEAQPRLHLVLAGTAALLVVLKHPELSQLNRRLNRGVSQQGDNRDDDDDTDEDDTDEDDTIALAHGSMDFAGSAKRVLASRTDRTNWIAGAALVIIGAVGLGVFANSRSADHAGTITAGPTDAAERGGSSPGSALPSVQPLSTDLTQRQAAGGIVPRQPPLAAPTRPPQLVPPAAGAYGSIVSGPAAPPRPLIIPDPPTVAESLRSPTPTSAAIPAPASVPLPGPAATPRAPEVSQQASVAPMVKRREPAPRRAAALPTRYLSRRPAGTDQPGADWAYDDADGRSVYDDPSPWLRDHPSYRRAGPQVPNRYEPPPQQPRETWPLPASRPVGTIGVYSGGLNGIRSFRSGPEY